MLGTLRSKEIRRQSILASGLLLVQLFLPLAASAESNLPQKKEPASAGSQAAITRTEIKLSLDDINDVAYALQRIRQQAINIFIEATRHRDQPEVTAQMPVLSTVPSELPKETNNLLPFRRVWLVYFITTIEPLVHLLKEDVKEIESSLNTMDISSEKRAALEPMIKEWTVGVSHINEQLARGSDMVEDADKNNIALAKLAGEMDKEITNLESVRDKAFDLVFEIQKDTRKSTH